MLAAMLTRLRGLLQRRRVAREVDDELRFHVEMETQSNISRGMPPAEARRVALRDLGGIEPTKETIRDVRAMSIEGLWHDARHALRVMRKNPRFTALAVVTLALGIGVNTTSAAVAYGILVRPLPYAEPARVVILNLLFADGGDLGFSPRALQDWLPRFRTVDAAAGYYRREVTVRTSAGNAVVSAAFVTDGFFEVLGTPAESGRLLSHRAPEIVVGRRWLARIVPRGPGAAVGTPASVSDSPRIIAGIMPSDFAFPDDEVGLWLPSAAMRAETKPESSGYSKIVARLKPGVTVDQFREDANRIRLELNAGSGQAVPILVSVAVLGESVRAGLRGLLLAAVGGALLVLIVACANVATLFIGRDVARQRELAARMALGAGASQLVRGVLVETALIAALASVAGMGLGAAVLRLFVSQAEGSISGIHRVALGFPIAGAIAALTAAVTLICAAVPAWHAAQADARPFLRAPSVSGPRAKRIREGLVVAQIALSCVLLVGAGLLARTVSALMQEDHGFRIDGAIEAKVVLSDVVLFDGTGRQTFVTDLLDRIRALPGVEHAGFGSGLPPRPAVLTLLMRVVKDNRDESRLLKLGTATPGYLRALGARFLAGRDFDDTDGREDAAGIILSESAASFLFPNEDPVGSTMSRLPAIFGIAGRPRVIGVVSDIKYDGLDSPAAGTIYIPWDRRPVGSGYLIVRAPDAAMLAPEIRRAVQTLDATVPVTELQTLREAMAQSIANRRVRALPAIGFGALSLAVALVGVLATLSALVAERRRELAIRAALGASPSRLTYAVVGRGLALTAVGVGLGLTLGASAARGLSAFLYGVSPLDARTFLGTALLVGGGAVLMTYAAALRARSMDALIILRSE